MHGGWLQIGDSNLSVDIHRARTAESSRVVLMPLPIGRDRVTSLRAHLSLAQECASRGVSVVRFDLSGNGESPSSPGGDVDPLQTWIDQITAMEGWARSAGFEEVAMVGMRSAALLLAMAAEQTPHAESWCAALHWMPVKRGRDFVRQQKLLLDGAAESTDEGHDEVDYGVGLRWTPATRQSWFRAEWSLPARDRVARSVVVVPSEEPVPPWLPTPSGEPGYSVIQMDGFAELLASEGPGPIPDKSVQAIADELCADAVPATGPVNFPGLKRQIRLESVNDAGEPCAVIEERVAVGGLALPGVLTRPATSPIRGSALLLSGSTEAKDGPVGGWARMARRLAARGSCILRFDRSGVGDLTDVNAEQPPWTYTQNYLDEVVAAAQWLLERSGFRPVGIGLCSGGYVVLHEQVSRHLSATAAINVVVWYRDIDDLTAKAAAQAAAEDEAPAGDRWKGARQLVRQWLPLPALKRVAKATGRAVPEMLLESNRSTGPVWLIFGPSDYISFASARGPVSVKRVNVRRKSSGEAPIRILQDERIDHGMMDPRGHDRAEKLLGALLDLVD